MGSAIQALDKAYDNISSDLADARLRGRVEALILDAKMEAMVARSLLSVYSDILTDE